MIHPSKTVKSYYDSYQVECRTTKVSKMDRELIWNKGYANFVDIFRGDS